MEGAKLQPGHTIKFQGLKGAAHLNGTEGTLVKFNKKLGRWGVRCESNGDIVNAKSENLARMYTKVKDKGSKRSSSDGAFSATSNRRDYDAKSFDALFEDDASHDGGKIDDVTDFRSILSPVDGMPPLWPRPPRWPFDPILTKKYAERLSIPLLFLSPDQRIADAAHRHFTYLMQQHEETKEEEDGDGSTIIIKKPASEWATLICDPSCWDAYHLGTDPTLCTAKEFNRRMENEVFREIGFHYSRPYELPQVPIPSFCDECGKECTSECGSCGEKYCSRQCMKKDWIHHRPTCEMIYDNQGPMVNLMSQMEMKECLTQDELKLAYGTKTQSCFSDEELFQQPPPREDCPICFLPLPLQNKGMNYQACCGKLICMGCIFAVMFTEIENGHLRGLCPFCRETEPSNAEALERTRNRAAKDQPNSIHQLGAYYSSDDQGVPQDYQKAIELRLRAGELGNASSYFSIASTYAMGLGDVKKDMAKARYYFELAAMGGDVQARHNLGGFELREGNFDRAMKHFVISAAVGFDDSLTTVQWGYKNGHLTKDDFRKALSAHKKAQDEMTSEQRDLAAKLFHPGMNKNLGEVDGAQDEMRKSVQRDLAGKLFRPGATKDLGKVKKKVGKVKKKG